MPYYEGQTGSTRGARGGGRQSDLLMQQLGTSVSNDSKDAGGSDDFAALGFDNNSTTSSAPLVFDESTDTRVGNPRRRRGNGKKLGNASNQSHAQDRPHAAGMIRNDEEVARRQQIIQGVASDQVVGSRPRGSATPSARPTAPASPVRPAPQPAVASRPPAGGSVMGRQQQQVGPITGISLNREAATADGDEVGRGKANPLTARIRELRGRRFINPITFVRENGGGIETFGIWLYEYRHIFIILTIIALAAGMLFNRYYSFAAGIAMILIGMWLDRIDDDNDTFIVYLCGIVTALLPFIISA